MYWTARRWLVCKNIQGRRRRREENPPSEIGVTWPQMCWGQRSARLCWNYRLGFYPQRTDLTVILETGSPPQRRTNFITTFFQLCLNKKKKRVDSKSYIQSSSTSCFPLTSYLISDIMGKPDLCEHDSLKIHGKKEHSIWQGAPRLLLFKIMLI